MSLPELELIKIDVESKEAAYIRSFEQKSGRRLGSADPVRLLLSTLAAVVSQHEAILNERYKQNFLLYARGSALDHKGAGIDTPRLGSAAAIVSVEFSMPTTLAFPVVIPAGTRVTAGTTYVFATDKEGVIAVGSRSVSLTATCTTAGEFANGLVPGQINRLVDPLPYITAVTNTGVSNGGSDPESDERYRLRLQTALEKFSVAGPEGAYRFYALSAHPDIVDVAVLEAEPGEVKIYPLMRGGELPSTEIVDLVQTVLNAAERRPLTDSLFVLSPEAVSYEINITYYIRKSDAGRQADIDAAVSAAVESFVEWQHSTLGLGINDSELIGRIKNAGAARVVVTSPSYTALTASQVAVVGNISVNYGGVE